MVTLFRPGFTGTRSSGTGWMLGLVLYWQHVRILSNFKTRTFAFAPGPASFVTPLWPTAVLHPCDLQLFLLEIVNSTWNSWSVSWDLSKISPFHRCFLPPFLKIVSHVTAYYHYSSDNMELSCCLYLSNICILFSGRNLIVFLTWFLLKVK